MSLLDGLFGPPNIEKLKQKRDVGGLIRVLKDNNANVRRDAAKALGKLRDSQAVEGLVAALKDKELLVREAAAAALGEIRDTEAVQPLVIALKDQDLSVRAAAADALANLGDCAVEPLLAALQDRDKTVRTMAVRSLGKLHRAQTAESLVAALSNTPEAFGAIRELGAAAVEPLIAALRNREKHVRCAAAALLGELRDPRAVDPLIAALKDTPSVALAAAEALGKLGDARAAAPLLSLVEDTTSNDELRGRASTSLHQIGPSEALTQMCEEAEIDALIAQLTRRYGVSNTPGDTRYSVREGERRSAMHSLVKCGERALERLIALAKPPVLDEEVRLLAMEALGQLGDARAVDPLVAALRDKEHRVRRKAASTLGKLQHPSAVAPLAATLDDGDKGVRKAAAEALERIGGPEAERALAEYRAGQDQEVQHNVPQSISVRTESGPRVSRARLIS